MCHLCWPRRLCVRHPRWRLQYVAGHCYYQLSVFFFSIFCFWPTSVKLPRLKISFPRYFGITRRYLQTNIVILFLTRKKLIFGRFFCFLKPTFGHGRLGHPKSMEYFDDFLLKKTISSICPGDCDQTLDIKIPHHILLILNKVISFMKLNQAAWQWPAKRRATE